MCLIDQTRLPHRQEIVRCSTVAEVVGAIRSMVVRGAPAIGVTAAYGMVLGAQQSTASAPADLIADLRRDKAALDASRPTAVNLRWATDRLLRCAETAPAALSMRSEPDAAGGAGDSCRGSGDVPCHRQAWRGAVDRWRVRADPLQCRWSGNCRLWYCACAVTHGACRGQSGCMCWWTKPGHFCRAPV